MRELCIIIFMNSFHIKQFNENKYEKLTIAHDDFDEKCVHRLHDKSLGLNS